jgi:acylaminoacyl-peptidase
MKRIKTVILFIIVCGTFLQAENKRPFTIDDYFKTQDISDIRISPDGEKVVFVKREIIADRSAKGRMKRKRDIYMVTLTDNEIHRLTSHEKDSSTPRWSPDGKYIAYLANTESNNLYKLNRLWLAPVSGEPPKCLSENLDREVRNIVWSSDSEFLFGLVPDKSRAHIYSFACKDGSFNRIIGGENRLSSINLSKLGDLFAFSLVDNDHPDEIFTAASDGSRLQQRTWLNQPLLDEVNLGKTERIEFKNPNGQTVEGFVLKPPDFDPANKYPLILKIHGGPQGTDGNYFSAEGQWYAANGYIVLWVNYRGSSDYGEAWQEAIAVDWYFKEYDDLMAAVDFMCEKDFVDSQRLGVTGVSYGGCMTSWIVGHTDRFAAAVAERFVVDNFSSFGVDDTAYWYEKDFGLPYDEKNFTQYRKTSPILYIKNCTTPILIIQCMEDHRCPLPQALQFYMGLKKLKKAETQLILYPREPHGIREIPHQSDRLQRIVSWFDLYMEK